MVVGAGLAGLTAATALARHGVEVTVLEARDRVGGRTRGIEVAPDAWADAGAAYLGDRHTELHLLLSELGIKTTPTTMHGASRFDLGQDARTEAGRFPPLAAVALGDLFDRLAELTARIDPVAPWRTPGAEQLDRQTAAEWAAEQLSHPDARTFFPLFLGEMMAADPAAVSVLHMAFYLRSGGGLRYLNAFEGGAQQDRVAGGAHQVCERLAAGLGDRVRTGEPVRTVHQEATGATVVTERAAYPADAVVLALPPLLAEALSYQPPLPAPRAGRHTTPGCAIKVHLVYPAPLWRRHGLSGWSVSATGPLLSTVDDSPADAGPGVLTGFVTGAEAHRFAALTPEQRRAAAEAHAARLFPELPPPTDCLVTDWVNDPYSHGCYAALLGPGDWLAHGPQLAAAHQRLFFAGTETSTEFFGLMEGAIRSGHRAAAQLLATC
ncbi:amine oxidase [Streptomyces tateyamensis]|uniref:Amine oxidase n=1 Tax=Streptomyces tateyamensis TaxID=565073 RepID=A0A2V4MYE2_9ACTN|nr:amine oxidase [Streptomyces tateyamensis]